MDGFITKEYLDTLGIESYEMTVKALGKDAIEAQVMRDMIHQAYKQTLIKSLKNRLHNRIETYLDSEEFLSKNPIFKEEKDKADKFITRYIFLTVNPEPSISLKIILETIKKCCSKVWMKNYMYAIEQRGDTEETAGLKQHIHFIVDIENGKKRHETIRELKNTFKKICTVDSPSVFNIKNIKDADLKNFIKYISGKKKDEIKHPKQIADKIFRYKNKLEPIYGVGEVFELYNNNNETLDDFDYNF